MSLFGSIGKAVTAPLTGGLSLVPWDKLASNGYSGTAYAPKPPLRARDIALPKGDLENSFSTIGTAASGGIDKAYESAKDRRSNELATLGRPVGSDSYGAERTGIQKSLDKQALESSLTGELGETAYQDVKNQRAYNQNLSLTDQIAAAMKPSLLDEIFQGIGTIGGAAGKYGALLKRSGYTGGAGTMTADRFSYGGDEAYA